MVFSKDNFDEFYCSVFLLSVDLTVFSNVARYVKPFDEVLQKIAI